MVVKGKVKLRKDDKRSDMMKLKKIIGTSWGQICKVSFKQNV